MMNDRATACGLLRRLREQRGWSWADQARALRAVADRLNVAAVTSTRLTSLQRSIARWESTATRTVPGERNQLLLAHLYARNSAGRLALGAGSDLETFLTALSHFGVPERGPGSFVTSRCTRPVSTANSCSRCWPTRHASS
jgi:transcriptional regulator with XRE-family HTH domain